MLKSHFACLTLNPVLNHAWHLSGINCHLSWRECEKQPLASRGEPFMLNGIQIMRDALLPAFHGMAPRGL